MVSRDDDAHETKAISGFVSIVHDRDIYTKSFGIRHPTLGSQGRYKCLRCCTILPTSARRFPGIPEYVVGQVLKLKSVIPVVDNE